MLRLTNKCPISVSGCSQSITVLHACGHGTWHPTARRRGIPVSFRARRHYRSGVPYCTASGPLTQPWLDPCAHPQPRWLCLTSGLESCGLGWIYKWKSGLVLSRSRHFSDRSGFLRCAFRNNCTTCALGEHWVSRTPSETCPGVTAPLTFPQ